MPRYAAVQCTYAAQSVLPVLPAALQQQADNADHAVAA